MIVSGGGRGYQKYHAINEISRGILICWLCVGDILDDIHRMRCDIVVCMFVSTAMCVYLECWLSIYGMR